MFICERITIVTTYYAAFDRMPLRGLSESMANINCIIVARLLSGEIPTAPNVHVYWVIVSIKIIDYKVPRNTRKGREWRSPQRQRLG